MAPLKVGAWVKKQIKLMYEQDNEAIWLCIKNKTVEHIRQDVMTIISMEDYVYPHILLNSLEIAQLMQKHFAYEVVDSNSPTWWDSIQSEYRANMHIFNWQNLSKVNLNYSAKTLKRWKVYRLILLDMEKYADDFSVQSNTQKIIKNSTKELFNDVKELLTAAAYAMESDIKWINGQEVEIMIKDKTFKAFLEEISKG